MYLEQELYQEICVLDPRTNLKEFDYWDRLALYREYFIPILKKKLTNVDRLPPLRRQTLLGFYQKEWIEDTFELQLISSTLGVESLGPLVPYVESSMMFVDPQGIEHNKTIA
jgi:hypothetical protein